MHSFPPIRREVYVEVQGIRAVSLAWHEVCSEKLDEGIFLHQEGRLEEDQANHEHLFLDEKINCEVKGFLALLPSSRKETAWHPPTRWDREAN